MSHDSSGPRPTPSPEPEAQPTTEIDIITWTADNCHMAVWQLADRHSDDEFDADLERYYETMADIAQRVDSALRRYDRAAPGVERDAVVREIESMVESISDATPEATDLEECENLEDLLRTWDPDKIASDAAQAVVGVIHRRGLRITEAMELATLTEGQVLHLIAVAREEMELERRRPELDRGYRRDAAQQAKKARKAARKTQREARRRGRSS